MFEVVPPHLVELAEQLYTSGLVDQVPNAISVNEYLPGQRIGMHADSPEGGDVITTLSLAGDCLMGFRSKRAGGATIPIRRRTLVQMAGASRHARHCIYPVAERRISIVFRHGRVG